MGPGADQNSRADRGRVAQSPAAPLLDRVQRPAGRFRPNHLPAGLAVLFAMLAGAPMPEERGGALAMKAWVAVAAAFAPCWLLAAANALAIDFYEIQIYTVD